MASQLDITELRLDLICKDSRSVLLKTLGSYYYGTQYDALQYDWDGHHNGVMDSDVEGFKVPISRRKPSIRVDVPRMIVSRLTAMMLGEEGWPDFRVEGDGDAEDYIATLAKESLLQSKFTEIRDRGGSCGTACASFAFINGSPRVTVHAAENVHVLQWEDLHEKRPAQVLETYVYHKLIIEDGKPVNKPFYYARYWDLEKEILWEPIPLENAKAGDWYNTVPSESVEHGYGFCPFYWCQNRPNTHSPDGFADYHNLTDDFDGINRLMSATLKGTIANVDPTVIIKEDPSQNPGNIRKGSENAIFSRGGAEYLELRGDSIKTSMELVNRIKQDALDASSVLLADIEYISARAQSAAALRMVYQPMLSQCDILRLQYGRMLTQILTGMLKAAKMILSQSPGPVETIEGRMVQHQPTVTLPPKVTYEEAESGERIVSGMVERSPGYLENILLYWPVYFKPTHQDMQMTIDGVTSAIDQTISRRTAVKATSVMFGVQDVDQELRDIETDKQREIELQAELAEATAGAGEQSGNLGDNKTKPVGEKEEV